MCEPKIETTKSSCASHSLVSTEQNSSGPLSCSLCVQCVCVCTCVCSVCVSVACTFVVCVHVCVHLWCVYMCSVCTCVVHVHMYICGVCTCVCKCACTICIHVQLCIVKHSTLDGRTTTSHLHVCTLPPAIFMCAPFVGCTHEDGWW